jgi:SAM-dependent methyltransferase
VSLPHDKHYWSYDAIADVYATDMGQSMPFDDVGWYRALCLRRGGSVLELGCGTGRILIELIAAGLDAIGVDRSLPMLQRLRKDAVARNLQPRVAQMDLRAVAVSGPFTAILAPYSLITYLTDREAAVDVLRQLRALLAPAGVIVIDAFVPQPVASFADFRLDYRRPHGERTLEREKRITANADGTNHIERRYRLCNSAGSGEAFVTDETIRPYAPGEIEQLCARAGLVPEVWSFDYGARADSSGARFASGTFKAVAG